MRGKTSSRCADRWAGISTFFRSCSHWYCRLSQRADEPGSSEVGVAVRGEITVGLRGGHQGREVVQRQLEARSELRVRAMICRQRLAREDRVNLDEAGLGIELPGGAGRHPATTTRYSPTHLYAPDCRGHQLSGRNGRF